MGEMTTIAKPMSVFLDCNHTLLAAKHIERELTVEVAFHQLSLCIVHIIITDGEIGSLHWYGRTLIHHIA